MPELPEIETIKRGLEKRIVGLVISGVVYDTAKMLKPSPEKVIKTSQGAKIIKIARRAKMLLVYLDHQRVLAFHLKLNGQLLVRRTADPPDKYVHVSFLLNQDRELRFAEQRKFGWVQLLEGEEEIENRLGRLGSEPLEAGFDAAYLGQMLAGTSRAIKIVLMDQQKIAGVGNIYATEALFNAGIDPKRPANNLSDSEVAVLYENLIKVLEQGIKYEGATDRDGAYLQVTGEPGHFQEHFAVYGREGEDCLNCRAKIKKVKLGGRGTYFCPRCQK